jgi:hypothetical protein
VFPHIVINSCESFFSLLKRGVYGSWHHVSKEHLPKYANEFSREDFLEWNLTFRQSIPKRQKCVKPFVFRKFITHNALQQNGYVKDICPLLHGIMYLPNAN